MKPVRIEIQIRDPKARIPSRSRTTDAGYDLWSLTNERLAPGEVVHIDTGMSVVSPPGCYFTVEGRSSLFSRGIVPFRGIIDATYTGPMIVSLMNVGKDVYDILKGDRVAQLVPHQIIDLNFEVVDEISPEYNIRGERGWGSSGR